MKQAEKWMISRLQRSIANEITCDEIPYEKALDILRKWKVFEDWTVYELNNRPVDVDELRECIERELGLL